MAENQLVKARSDLEIQLWLELHPCERCGDAVADDAFERRDRALGGGGAEYAYEGTCPRCGTRRSFAFELPQAWVDGFGGPEPSELISAEQFSRRSEQLADGVPASPDGLDVEQIFDATRRLARAIAMVEEARKLLPSDGDLAARVTVLRAQREPFATAAARVSVRAARPARRDALDRAALAAHRAWLARGGAGEGRLVIEGAVVAGSRLGSVKLDRARLTRVDLDGALLDFASLRGAELVECTAVATDFAHAVFDDASLDRCAFDRAELGLCDLRDVKIRGGSFQRARADRSVWNRALVSGVDLREMWFGDAVLDGAVFEDCDLRGADLSRVTEVLPGLCTTLNTTFRRCDLRGADLEGRSLDRTAFVDCRSAPSTG